MLTHIFSLSYTALVYQGELFMKLYKTLLLLSVTTLLKPLDCQPIHDKHHDTLLLSMPKSGSNFFANTLVKANPNVNYLHEYFNKLHTVQMAEYLGFPIKRLYTEYFFALEIPKDKFKVMYEVTWQKEDANFTKEVFSNFRVPLLQDYFTLFALYRHRKHTFPTGSSHLFLPLYQSFASVHFQDPTLKKIQTFVKKHTFTDEQKDYAIHTVANYIMLRDCARYNIPVIDYKKLLTLTGQKLFDYLKETVPATVFTSNLPSLIEKERKKGNFLQEREERYKYYGLEFFCKKIITFLKELDPAMPYWYLFDLQ